MKKLFLFCAITAITMIASAQSYNSDLNDLGQYVQRMYMNEPFEGARVVENVDNCYLITVVAEKPGKSDYTTSSKAELKGLSYANDFLNGTQTYKSQILHMTEDSKGYSNEQIEEVIESRSMGYVQTMQVLSTFTHGGKKVFVYCKQLPMPEKAKGKKGKKRK